jgi:hypothetical protein
MGTDANQAEFGDDVAWRDWYRSATTLSRSLDGGLGYRDPIHEICEGSVEKLRASYRSLGVRRVDYLLFKTVRGREPRLVTADMLPHGSREKAKWSDHRSMYVQIRY